MATRVLKKLRDEALLHMLFLMGLPVMLGKGNAVSRSDIIPIIEYGHSIMDGVVEDIGFPLDELYDN